MTATRPDSSKSEGTRLETDSLGTAKIPQDRYWGPQTERARLFFRIGTERLPPIAIRAVGWQKLAAAQANLELGELPPEIANPIIEAAREVASGRRYEDFPLPIWQTGSGTQTNMNANEVIANLANQALGQPLGSRSPIHPNDHVNRGQSSNDSFPTVMHVATARQVVGELLPALRELAASLEARAAEWRDIVKIGRTHLMDAVPITLGQEAATWALQVSRGIARIEAVLPRLLELPQGGTAVGTGLNRHPDFDIAFCRCMSRITGLPFTPHPHKFEAMAAHDTLVELSGALNTIAVSLTKIANDLRLLASGPRAGLAELTLPEDGLSSSIMPGKTNATQSEALSMVCAQVMGNHVTVTIAGAQGHLELNVFKPVILHAVLQSVTLLADAARSFAGHMVGRLEPNRERIADDLARSLMLVTALAPRIGYDKAVAIGRLALKENLTLREAASRSGHVTAEDFDRWVRPEEMLHATATVPDTAGPAFVS
ncbi:class II fumarate hydratase [Acetobacteraceae bacterium H6797]|nr:class II fumarate hydratase [Acetobacteraceae bacterium H6797]